MISLFSCASPASMAGPLVWLRNSLPVLVPERNMGDSGVSTSHRWQLTWSWYMIYDIYTYMIWYDMIWYDMIWYDMIWYDMIWYDMIIYDIYIYIIYYIHIYIYIYIYIYMAPTINCKVQFIATFFFEFWRPQPLHRNGKADPIGLQVPISSASQKAARGEG